MAYQSIGLGTTEGDGTGDTLRIGGDKVNDNFVEIYTLLGTGTALTSGISATSSVVTLGGPTITGVASFAAGSVSAPSITKTGDTNTGIFFSAADKVNVTTGGTERIEIDSAGLAVVGAVAATGAVSGTTGTFSGILKTDDATEATSTTDGSLQTDGGLSVVKDIVAGDDIKMLSDAAALHFGADSEVTLTHYADNGLRLKHTATADDKPVVFVLQTGETDIAADDVIGSIRWQAPDEGTGTDAILVSAAIDAISEGDFSSSSNATKLAFRTGSSETASEKMSLSSGGNLALPTDAVVLNFGADSDVNLTHVADTGLLLNSTRQLQFNDASQYISGASATKMDIRATDEIELTSTLVDVVGALTVSGTTTLNGALVLGDAAADTLTVNATLQGASPLTFEGGTADGYETTFAITDPTADRTITFPNKSMTVAGLDDVTALAIALG